MIDDPPPPPTSVGTSLYSALTKQQNYKFFGHCTVQLHMKENCLANNNDTIYTHRGGQEWRRIRLAARKQATPKWAWQALDPLHRLGAWLGGALNGGGDIRPALGHWAYKGEA